jgi:hypothetical protein
VCIGPVHWIWGALTPPPPRPARPPAQHVAETRYRDSSGSPVRNRLPGGWGGGWRESSSRPLFPVSIRYTRDGMGIRVNLKNWDLHFFISLFIAYFYIYFLMKLLLVSLQRKFYSYNYEIRPIKCLKMRKISKSYILYTLSCSFSYSSKCM